MSDLTACRLPVRRPSRDDHDVIVVGARVAGAATAMLLARSGLRVLLVDRAPAPGTDTLSTHALMRAGVLQLARWGLRDDLVAADTPAVRRTTVHYGDEAEVVEIKERAGVDALYAPRRTVLDPLLVAAAAAAGAEVRFGVAVEGLLRDGARVVGVEGTARDGRPFRATARWVVGADGVGSRVAREVEAPVTWQGRASGAFVYGYWRDFEAHGPEIDGYHWFYRPGLSAGVMPTNDGECCVWAGAPTKRFLGELRHDLEGSYRQLLAAAAPRLAPHLAAAERVGRLRAFPGVPGFLRRPWGSGWALVGDAASFRDPISAHGITDALRDAELLARALVANLGSPRGDLGPLALYELQRDESALDLAEITEEIAAYGWDLPRLRVLLLDLAKAMRHELELLAALPAEDLAAVA